MTSTLARTADTQRGVASEPGSTRRPRRYWSANWRMSRWAQIVGLAAAGIIVIGFSYRLSANAAAPTLYYSVFWIGLLGALVPICREIGAADTARWPRMSAILLFGIVTAIPKYLRNPDAPRYHDEYAHWREAIDVMLSGRLFQPNTLIPIVEYFPGTSALTETSRSLSGLGTWSAGALVVGVMHVLGLFAVYLLGSTILDSARAGGVAVIVYGINPSAIYFDTQYAYESIAVNFFLWVLALTSIAARSHRGSDRRRGILCAAVLFAAGIVVTHHLTTLFLIMALSTIALSTSFLSWRARNGQRFRAVLPVEARDRRVWWIMLGCTVSFAVAWVGIFARPTLDYLSPYFGSSLRQLGSMADKKTGGRQLLAANVQPWWEQVFTAAAPAALLAIVAVTWLLLRGGRRRIDATTAGFFLYGLGYFVSLPFILAPSGAEGARRSWGFTYIGIALIVAFVAVHMQSRNLTWFGRDMRPWMAGALFVTLLVGNVGGGLNDPYRFPGPFRWGTDTNSASEEARAVARELEATLGRVRVVSDAYTALQLAAYGGLDVAAPSTGFPAWELAQSGEDPSPELAGMLIGSAYDFLVVDVRMGQEPPFNGHNFGNGDPLLGQTTPMAYLTRLDSVPWAARVVSTEHLRAYRLDLSDIAKRMEQPQ